LSLMAACLFLYLLFQIGYLLYLIHTAKQTSMCIDGMPVILLQMPQNRAVCSFKLWHNYIIWQNELNKLSSEEQKGVLFHEIAHLKQYDTWYKIALRLVQAIWLLNPAFYWLHREIDQLNEYLADEFAVAKTGNVRVYATVLVKLKRQQKTVLSHSFKTGAFKKRIQILLNKHQPPVNNFVQVSLLFGLLFCLWFTTTLSINTLNKQVDKLRAYQAMTYAYEKNGSSVLCKNCLFNNTDVDILKISTD